MRAKSGVFSSKSVTRALVLWAFLSCPAWAATADETLIQLLDDFLAGASRNDMAMHDRFWSEDLVYTSSSGARFGKAEIMAPKDSAEDAAAADEPAMVYGREALLVRVYDDTAVVTFRLVGTTQTEPPSVAKFHNTGVFLLRDGEWRAVAWQATKMPDEQ